MGSMISSLSLLRSIYHSPGASKDYLTSHTLTFLNPHSYPYDADTLSIHLHSSTIQNLTDEHILALFTKGFFGGPIFRIESWLLRAGLWKVIGIPHSPELSGASQPAKHIWDVSKIPETSKLPLYSTIFNAFQLLTTHIPTSPHHHPHYSYFDFSYGTSSSHFAGNHRFVVRRPGRPSSSPSPWTILNFQHPQGENQSEGEEVEMFPESMADELEEGEKGGREVEVEIRLEMWCCDPSNPKGVGLAVRGMRWFHNLYGRLLFLDGVRRVVRGEEDEGRKRG